MAGKKYYHNPGRRLTSCQVFIRLACIQKKYKYASLTPSHLPRSGQRLLQVNKILIWIYKVKESVNGRK